MVNKKAWLIKKKITVLVCLPCMLGSVPSECLLHISYHLDIKKCHSRSQEDKCHIRQLSEEIKQKFKKQMGLIVNRPKPLYGNTNDGNTAGRFFLNPEKSGEITGAEIIKKLYLDL